MVSDTRELLEKNRSRECCRCDDPQQLVRTCNSVLVEGILWDSCHVTRMGRFRCCWGVPRQRDPNECTPTPETKCVADRRPTTTVTNTPSEAQKDRNHLAASGCQLSWFGQDCGANNKRRQAPEMGWLAAGKPPLLLYAEHPRSRSSLVVKTTRNRPGLLFSSSFMQKPLRQPKHLLLT